MTSSAPSSVLASHRYCSLSATPSTRGLLSSAALVAAGATGEKVATPVALGAICEAAAGVSAAALVVLVVVVPLAAVGVLPVPAVLCGSPCAPFAELARSARARSAQAVPASSSAGAWRGALGSRFRFGPLECARKRQSCTCDGRTQQATSAHNR
eukprot:6181849-Pleurochrysis_carterae.AAC.2